MVVIFILIIVKALVWFIGFKFLSERNDVSAWAMIFKPIYEQVLTWLRVDWLLMREFRLFGSHSVALPQLSRLRFLRWKTYDEPSRKRGNFLRRVFDLIDSSLNPLRNVLGNTLPPLGFRFPIFLFWNRRTLNSTVIRNLFFLQNISVRHIAKFDVALSYLFYPFAALCMSAHCCNPSNGSKERLPSHC